jgi:tetratricopeptide (TPR) repeat protein
MSGNEEVEVPGSEVSSPNGQGAGESVEVAAQPEGTEESTDEVESTPEAEVEPDAESETPTPSETSAEEPVSEPVANEAEAAGAAEAGSEPEDPLKEASNKRKKWLEEQDKIKAELANIMSRVGKKKTSATMMGGGSPMADMPQGQTSTAAPYSKPVGVTPQLNPMDDSQVMTQPVEGAPTQPMAQGAQEGLSDFDKKELLRELDDLRAEGYDVSRLESIIEEDPGNAWKAFSEFLDDIEKVNKQRGRLEGIDTTGFDELSAQKDEILNMANNPDLLQDVIAKTDELEQLLESSKQEQITAPPLGPAPGAEEARKIEQIEKYISAGKDALRLKDYDKALKIFTKTLELDPNNKEIQFFQKKLEAKLSESPTAPSPIPTSVSASAHAPAQAPAPGYSPQPQQPMEQQPLSVSAQPQAVSPTPVAAQPQRQAVSPVQAPKGKKKKKKKKVVPQQPTPQPSVAEAPVPTPVAAVDDNEIEGPKTAAEYEALGFNAYINKDYPKALEFFEKVLELDPSFPNVENLKNECLIRLGRA